MRRYADNHDNDQRYWDAWFRMLQPSTSKVPWSVALGKCVARCTHHRYMAYFPSPAPSHDVLFTLAWSSSRLLN